VHLDKAIFYTPYVTNWLFICAHMSCLYLQPDFLNQKVVFVSTLKEFHENLSVIFTERSLYSCVRSAVLLWYVRLSGRL